MLLETRAQQDETAPDGVPTPYPAQRIRRLARGGVDRQPDSFSMLVSASANRGFEEDVHAGRSADNVTKVKVRLISS